MLTSLFVLWLLAPGTLLSTTSTPQTMKQLYAKGSLALKQQQWPEAIRAFQALYPMLKQTRQRHTKDSQQQHMMTIGMCDVLYQLARVHWQLKHWQRSCYYDQLLNHWRKTLPANWTTWGMRTELPRRFQTSQTHLSERCQRVSASVVVNTSPADATIAYQESPNRWITLKKKRFKWLGPTLTLRIAAKGFLPQVTRTSIPRWRTTSLTFRLKRQPIALKPRPRKPIPKPPTAFYKTWWFWTIAGVAVAGASTATILVLTLPQPTTFKTPGSKGFVPWR